MAKRKNIEAVKWHDKGSTLADWSTPRTHSIIEDYKEAIKCFDKVIKLDPKNTRISFDKEIVLKKLGKHEEAEKCFEEIISLVWSRILKNEGKLMKTKRGVVFSYRITKNKKSIMPQYRLQNSGQKFPVYGEARYISYTLVERALDIFPTKGPTELKRLLEMQSLDPSHTHLWAILNDESISNGDW